MKDVCVCVLAYNEQRHIANTIQAILCGNGDMDFDIVVYANGCTDRTADVVKELCQTIANLRLRELSKPSKSHAWTTAFAENVNAILFFSDGDVRPEPGSVVALSRCLGERPEVALVCSQLWPDTHGLSFEQRLTGFLQIPLAQDFLTGFYAIRRSHLLERLREKGLDGIPEGVVGEDEFLQRLVPANAFLVARQKVFYRPPVLNDYWKYLARMRWQEEQRLKAYGDLFADDKDEPRRFWSGRVAKKLRSGQGLRRTLLGVASSGLRTVVKSVFKAKIDTYYRDLGPVCREGRNILSQATRSESAK